MIDAGTIRYSEDDLRSAEDRRSECDGLLRAVEDLKKEIQVYDNALFIMCFKAGMSGEDMQELLRRCRLPLAEQIKEIQAGA